VTDQERIARLEHVVGTLIVWLYGAPLDKQSVEVLVDLLKKGDS
jgi:hypothetical protein